VTSYFTEVNTLLSIAKSDLPRSFSQNLYVASLLQVIALEISSCCCGFIKMPESDPQVGNASLE